MGAVGRPSINVSEDDILFLKGLNYSWTKIADILGISRRTLYRRLEEFSIDPRAFTEISQSELDELLKSIKSTNPNCGEVMIQGSLIHRGIRVPREMLFIEWIMRILFKDRHLSSVVEYILLPIQMLYGIWMVIIK